MQDWLSDIAARRKYRNKLETEEERMKRLAVRRAKRKEISKMEMEEEKAQMLASRRGRAKKCRERQTEEQKARRLAAKRARHKEIRERETEAERAQRLAVRRVRTKEIFERETEEERARRLAAQRAHAKKCRERQTEEQKEQRRAADCAAQKKKRHEMKKAEETSAKLKQHYGTLSDGDSHSDTHSGSQHSLQTSQPSTTAAVPRIHWLYVDEFSEPPVSSMEPNDTVAAVTGTVNSSQLYVYKVDNIELACHLAQEQNRHVCMSNTVKPTVSNRQYKCRHCDESFKSFYLRYKHCHVAHPGLRCPRTDRAYLCIMCYFTCLRLDQLLSHLVDNHVRWRLFICGICHKAFSYLSTCFREHCLSHKKSHSCSVCGKLFTTAGSLKTHSLIHSNELQYRCEMCDKRFRYKCQLTWHISHVRSNMFSESRDGPSVCTDYRPYRCQYCDKGFTTPPSLKLHIANRHVTHVYPADTRRRCQQQATPMFTCQFCGQRFRNREGVERHENRVHRHSELKYRCEHCHKSFEIKRSLKVHLLAVHSDINIEQLDDNKLYNCPDCQQLFKHRQQLLQHIAIKHT